MCGCADRAGALPAVVLLPGAGPFGEAVRRTGGAVAVPSAAGVRRSRAGLAPGAAACVGPEAGTVRWTGVAGDVPAGVAEDSVPEGFVRGGVRGVEAAGTRPAGAGCWTGRPDVVPPWPERGGCPDVPGVGVPAPGAAVLRASDASVRVPGVVRCTGVLAPRAVGLPSPVALVRESGVAGRVGVPAPGAAAVLRASDVPVREPGVARCTGVPATEVLATRSPGASAREAGVPLAAGVASRRFTTRWTGAPDAGAPCWTPEPEPASETRPEPGPEGEPGRDAVPGAVAPPAGPPGDAAVPRRPVESVGREGEGWGECAARWTGAPVGAAARTPDGPVPGTERAAGDAEGAGAAEAAEAVEAAGTPREEADAGAEAAPGSPRSPSGDDGAGPGEPGTAPVARRLAGRARRCTAAATDGALVRDSRARDAAGGTGVARTPWAPRATAPTGAVGAEGADGTAERDRWTGGRGAGDDADVAAADGDRLRPAGTVVAADDDADAGEADADAADPGPGPGPGGIARSGATGIRRTAGSPPGDADGRPREGRSGSAAGRADSVNAPESRPRPAPGSRTAGDGAPLNDGFCHVGSRPPNPESATPVRPSPVARWIGGRDVHAATATAPDGPAPPGTSTASDVPAVLAVAVVPSGTEVLASAAGLVEPAPPSRPRSRSRNPTDQPSAAPRVTRDAICSVYRRRSWCSRSRIASRPQWKW